MRRDLWIVVQTLAGTVEAVDSCFFCSEDMEEREVTDSELAEMAEAISEKVSRNQLENTIVLLEKALKLKS